MGHAWESPSEAETTLHAHMSSHAWLCMATHGAYMEARPPMGVGHTSGEGNVKYKSEVQGEAGYNM